MNLSSWHTVRNFPIGRIVKRFKRVSRESMNSFSEGRGWVKYHLGYIVILPLKENAEDGLIIILTFLFVSLQKGVYVACTTTFH